MHSRPASISDDAIARAIAGHWPAETSEIAEVVYLPWGFGAHHWRVAGGGTALFVTWDELGPRHTAGSLEAAYAGAAALAAGGLEVMCAPLPHRAGRFTVEAAGGALSVTPWLDGRTPTEAEACEPGHVRGVVAALAALHDAEPPGGLRDWAPRVAPSFADALRARTTRPWTSGPLGEEARAALAARGEEIGRWTARYHELAESALAGREGWVPTHGEPHYANQVVGAFGLRLVDWESLVLAPRERDYGDLLAAGARLRHDPAMVELFALDWRLSEIAEYARWFASPHTGSEDDRTALEGLFEELSASE
ncbi:aminoglycoside phosphotransferase [Streptomyces noursei]|uniref:aminoglycoside phosphotransferase n=1 Tax=Streptomyces noursei TaxID=1971 RepID=UPI0030F07085